MGCPNCLKPINEGQWAQDGKLKSCPHCSEIEGQHIFLPYPRAFGRSGRRASEVHTDGPQSHCRNCRSWGQHNETPVKCSELNKVKAKPPVKRK